MNDARLEERARCRKTMWCGPESEINVEQKIRESGESITVLSESGKVI